MDLELATLNDIADELKRRYSGMLLVVTGPVQGQADDGEEGTALLWNGGAIMAIGLAEFAKLRLSIPNAVVEIVRESDDEDAEADEP